MEQENSCTKIEIYKANEVLKAHLASIRSIEGWALTMGYKIKEFSILYRKHFGQKCKKAMVQIRIQHACDLIKQHSESKYYQIAAKIGLSDEYALYKYFMRHVGKPPSYFRKKGE